MPKYFFFVFRTDLVKHKTKSDNGTELNIIDFFFGVDRKCE